MLGGSCGWNIFSKPSDKHLGFKLPPSWNSKKKIAFFFLRKPVYKQPRKHTQVRWAALMIWQNLLLECASQILFVSLRWEAWPTSLSFLHIFVMFAYSEKKQIMGWLTYMQFSNICIKLHLPYHFFKIFFKWSFLTFPINYKLATIKFNIYTLYEKT